MKLRLILAATALATLAGQAALADKLDIFDGDDSIAYNPTNFERKAPTDKDYIAGNPALGKPVVSTSGEVLGKVTGAAPEGHSGKERLYITLASNDGQPGKIISVMEPDGYAPMKNVVLGGANRLVTR